MKRFFLFFVFVIPFFVGGEENSLLEFDSCSSNLFRDLELVEKINQKTQDRLPLMVNYQLQGGYFTMPSARSFSSGILGFGFSYVPPYRIWNLGFQLFDHLEITGNYWVFHGITEGNFGHQGFGDDAERAANMKVILLRKEEGFPFLPDFALGWNDFLGSCRFSSFYFAATQEFLDYNLEATLGWGLGRIKGFYGGLAWSPLRHSKYFWKNLILSAEYDANDYRKHAFEHSGGRKVKSRINAGVQLQFWDLFSVSASSLRGEEWAASGALHYNFGSASGFFPKIYDPPIYTAPVDKEPLGFLRSKEELAQEFAYAFRDQGFDLYSLYVVPSERGEDHLWMKIINVRYREEEDVRERLERVLAALCPANITSITTVLEADGVPTHEYKFFARDLKRYAEGRLGEQEFRIIAPMREATPHPSDYDGNLVYKRRKPVWMLTFRPWMRAFFGSSKGKFKYETGFSLGPEGYLFDEIYYSLYGSYTAKSSMQNIGDRDALNPSRIINVRTDALKYNQSSSFHVDQAFLQKSWNWGGGWFSRLALGYFETAYAGIATETLYYPVQFNWALGFQVATFLKRNYYGLGFQHKIRKLTSEGYQYFPYTGLQYFIDFYYQYKPYNLDFKVSAGQFLARDKGVRIEGARTFLSGLRVGLWYTLTNGNDVVNNKRYYDKGFFISCPLDFFMNQSSRTRLSYAMSAWLRDVGAQASTGKPLYPTLYWERYNTHPVIN